MPRPRLRGLTQADRALWRAYAADVAPLPGRDLPPDAAPPSAPAPPDRAPLAAVPATPLLPAAARAAAPAYWLPPPEIEVNAPPAGLDAKRWRELRRGRTRPERTLDLHGRRAQDAHGAVRAFLVNAYADGLRCVAVITGRGSSAEGGVLRRELPHWLNAPELRRILLGAAHPHSANTGAVHLLLRRRR